MSKRPNTVGGGAKTNENGLRFEARADLRDVISAHPDYTLENEIVYLKGKKIAYYYEKHGLYKNFLEPRGVNFRSRISSKLLPDSALLVDSTMYIIEKKYQASPGSVSEKLQTCDFKKKQYEKLFLGLGIKIEYYYVLNDWFEQSSFEDVFEYIESVGCKYFIEYLPLSELGL